MEDSWDVLKFAWYDSCWFFKEFKKVYHFDTLLNLELCSIVKQNIYDVVNYSKNPMESKILNTILRNIVFFFPNIYIYIYIYITDFSIIDFWDYQWKILKKW